MKPEDFGPITLSRGAHHSPSDGMCFMEMTSFLAGEKWSDRPRCSCPVLSEFGRSLNDTAGDKTREKLISRVPRMIGTASLDHEELRAGILVAGAARAARGVAAEDSCLREAQYRLRIGHLAGAASPAALVYLYQGLQAEALAALDEAIAAGPHGEAYSEDALSRVPALVEALA